MKNRKKRATERVRVKVRVTIDKDIDPVLYTIIASAEHYKGAQKALSLLRMAVSNQHYETNNGTLRKQINDNDFCGTNSSKDELSAVVDDSDLEL